MSWFPIFPTGPSTSGPSPNTGFPVSSVTATPHPAGSVAVGSTPSQPMVVVWEWQDDKGLWRPYSGAVSSYIESHYSPTGKSAGVWLGAVDKSLSAYLVDVSGLKQYRRNTGKSRALRRSLFHLSSGLASGSYWEWINSKGVWTSFEMHITILLEQSYQALQGTALQGTADLRPYGYNYTVDLRSMTQVNTSTGTTRQVRRQAGTPYPLTPSASSAIPSGPASSSSQLFQSHGGTVPAPTHLPTQNAFSFQLPNLPQHTISHSVPAPNHTFSFPPGQFGSMAGRRSGNRHNMGSANASSVQQNPLASRRPEAVIQRFMEEVKDVPDEDCTICIEHLLRPSGYAAASSSSSLAGAQGVLPGTVGKFTKCGHAMHVLCVLAMYNSGSKDGSIQCPTCKTIYGEKTGTQPDGTMDVFTMAQSLPGHPGCGTIQIIYNISSGVQGPEHPSPGQLYSCRGFPRACYLPDSQKGRKVLELLRVAWARRLVFAVGTSSTSGENNTVVWNEIHHKTDNVSNQSGHGYPDPDYLDNVLLELAAQGVTEDCLKQP